MRFILRILLLICCAASTASAAKTEVKLLLSAQQARPGEAIVAGVRFRLTDGWHTYWKNSGDSGAPIEVKWELPAGVTAGNILWPLPKKLVETDLTTYIYENEVTLLIPLKFEATIPKGEIILKAHVVWLECEKLCIPRKTDVQAALLVGGASQRSPDADSLDAVKQKIPEANASISASASWENDGSKESRPLVIEWRAQHPLPADFFPYVSEFNVLPDVAQINSPGKIGIRKSVKSAEGKWPDKIAGVLIENISPTEQHGYEVELVIPDSEKSSVSSAATPSGISTPPSLWKMLLYAFIGGLILNVMPCVLPVIALKILGFVQQNKESPREVAKLGIVYSIGVLFSFLVLAGLIIAVKQAGHRAGWGMQFGNPQFIVILTVLVMLVALNLFGLFEINLSGRVLGAAGSAAGKHGAAGAFFNGVLATTLATPCTAPFLGVALGFAFTQSAWLIILIFLTVGFGLALPYALLSFQPKWLGFLPKPGAWMEKFKIAMGFPMLATAVWLFTLTPLHYGKRVWWLGLFLVFVAAAAWVYGEFVQRGRTRKPLAFVIVLILLCGGFGYAIESQLQWRAPLQKTETAGSLKESPDGIDWQAWSPEAVVKAREAGRPVFVDFTADWCVTCQVNKKTSIEISSVRQKLKEMNAVALLGDYTAIPEIMTKELNHFGRAGVPLVLVYSKDKDVAPEVLPEFLTSGIVLDALNRAGK